MIQSQGPLLRRTPETQPFWDALKRHELVLPRCTVCGRLRYYPKSYCPECSSWELEWVKCSGRGRIYSYLISHSRAVGFDAEAPHVIAVIELEEGLRILSDMTGLEPGPVQVQVDMPVEIVFKNINDDSTMFNFRPA